MIKHFCNCCNKKLDGGNWVRIEYRLIDVNTVNDITQESRKYYSDLCPKCYSRCIKVLKGVEE